MQAQALGSGGIRWRLKLNVVGVPGCGGEETHARTSFLTARVLAEPCGIEARPRVCVHVKSQELATSLRVVC